jgi:hypothetical protein
MKALQAAFLLSACTSVMSNVDVGKEKLKGLSSRDLKLSVDSGKAYASVLIVM